MLFMIKIKRIIWKETFIEKIEGKHHVTMSEVEEILHGRKEVYRIAKGDVKGEEMEFDIQKRTFLVPVDSRIYLLAKKQAEAEHRTVEQIINALLNRDLIKAK